MSATIKLRRSSVAGNKPTTSQLDLGEVAINTHDGTMFFKRDKNGELSIIELGGASVAENVFYVSKSGDDSNDGTSLDKAFLTIDKALEEAAKRRGAAGLDSDGAEGSVLETKTRRDLQYYIDGSKYDIALGTTFNQIFQGRAGSYTKGKDEVLSSLDFVKDQIGGDSNGLLVVRSDADIQNRSNAYWDELKDIIDSGRDNADALDSDAYPQITSYYTGSTIEDNATRSRRLLLDNKLFFAEEVSNYIEKQIAEAPTWYNFTYNQAKCERDVKLLVDAVRYDTLFGTNIRSVSAAIRYFNGTAAAVIDDQRTQTTQSFTEAKEYTLLNLTDSNAKVTAGALWDEIIQIVDSGDSNIAAGTGVADAYNYIPLLGGTAPYPGSRDSNFAYAADQILENRAFLQEDVIAFIDSNVTNNIAPFTSSFNYDSVSCRRDTGLIIDAVIYDTVYGGNQQSYDAALAYFVGTQSKLGSGQKDPTIAALNRLKESIAKVAKEETVNTASGHDAGITQVNTTSPAASDSAASFAQDRVGDVVYYIEQDGVNKPTRLYADTTWPTSTLQAQFALLDDSAQTDIADSTTGWINDQISLAESFNGFNYTASVQTKSKRDTRFTIEALTYDATYLGNAASYDNAAFFQNNDQPQIPAVQRGICKAAFNRLGTVVNQVLLGDSVELSDSTGAYGGNLQQFNSVYPDSAKATELSGLITMTARVIDSGLDALPASRITPDLDTETNFDSATLNAVDGSNYKAAFDQITIEDSNIINDTITYLDSEAFPGIFGVGDRYQDILDAPEIASTIYVKTGEYFINNPVEIPKNVSLIGDNLKNTSIRPINKTSDMFYLNNNAYVSDFTFRDHLQPAAVFAWDPTGDSASNIIVNSPYIRNCTSITGPDLSRNDDGTYVYPKATDSSQPADGGDGIRNDGNHSGGIRSMVVDSFTQINQGGKGIYLKNRGYCQLVSVFTVYCDVAFLAENGGFASITNSNSSFGNIGLKATGVSNSLYDCNVNGTQNSANATFLDNIINLNNLTQKPNVSDAVKFQFDDLYYTVDSASYDSATGTGSIKLLEAFDSDQINGGQSVTFHQRSALSSSGHTFEWIGTGTDVRTAFPYRGGIPAQADEVIQDSDRGGLCFVTSTDQKGDFRVGEGFLIQRSTGTIEGEAFDRSLFARITPFSLALED